jgi:hypothetical protein
MPSGAIVGLRIPSFEQSIPSGAIVGLKLLSIPGYVRWCRSAPKVGVSCSRVISQESLSGDIGRTF